MMGYAAVQHVLRLFTYEQAKWVYDKAMPIRGTTTRPLGRRRDHRMYSVRENKDGHIELVCYNTPVVTYEQGGTVRVKIDGWNSVSTRQFIQQTLGIPTGTKKDYCILEIQGGKYTLKKDEELLLTRGGGDGGKGWEVLNNHPRMSYRINRKGANNVRATYKPFIDYLKGFVALRTETVNIPGVWGRASFEAKQIHISMRELANTFGVQDKVDVFAYLAGKPNGSSINASTPGSQVTRTKRTITVPGVKPLIEKLSKVQRDRARELLGLVKSGDHEKFYKAAILLCGSNYETRFAYDGPEADSSIVSVEASQPMKVFDKFILMHHARETVEVYPTPAGKVPSETHKAWLDIANKWEEWEKHDNERG